MRDKAILELRKEAERTKRAINSGGRHDEFNNRMMSRLNGFERAIVALGLLTVEEVKEIVNEVFAEWDANNS